MKFLDSDLQLGFTRSEGPGLVRHSLTKEGFLENYGGFPGFLDIYCGFIWIYGDFMVIFSFPGRFLFFEIYGDFLLSGIVGNNRGTYFLQRNVYRATASHLSGTSEKIQPLRSASMFTTKQDDVDGLKVNI